MERRNFLVWGGAILTAVAAIGSGFLGCGGSTDPRANTIVGAPGQTGTGGGAPPTSGTGGGAPPTSGTGGGAASDPTASPGSTIFAESYGDDGEQGLAGMAVDAKGNVYVAGNEQPVSLAPAGTAGPLPMEGTAKGVFLLQYSPTGQLMWRQPFVGGPNTFTLEVKGVAVQPTTGLEILLGSLGGSVTIDGTTLSSGVDPKSGLQQENIWLTAIDSAGYVNWTKVISSTGFVDPDHLFVTSSGDIEITGAMADNVSVGGGPLCCGNGNTGPRFVARYSPTGEHIWSYAVTGFFFPIGEGADADGGLVLGGGVNGELGYRGETFVSGAPFTLSASAVLRLDPQGNKRWVQTYISPSQGSIVLGAALDPSQNVILYGSFNGPLDLGGGHTFTGPDPKADKTDGLLAKLAPADGTPIWAQQIAGGLGNQTGAGVATDAAGDIAFVNTGDGFNAGPTFGGVAPLPPTAPFGTFVVELGPDGTFLWTRGWDTGFAVSGGAPSPAITGAAFDPSGRLAISGNFDTTVDFGTGPLTAPGKVAHTGSAPGFIPNNVFTLMLAP
jgi:hypothetical protein